MSESRTLGTLRPTLGMQTPFRIALPFGPFYPLAAYRLLGAGRNVSVGYPLQSLPVLSLLPLCARKLDVKYRQPLDQVSYLLSTAPSGAHNHFSSGSHGASDNWLRKGSLEMTRTQKRRSRWVSHFIPICHFFEHFMILNSLNICTYVLLGLK